MLAYLRLMIKNRIAGFKPSNMKQEGRSKTKIVISYIGYLLLGILLYGSVIAFEIVIFMASKNSTEPEAVIAIAFLLCTFITLFYGFFHVIGMLFFGKDNGFIAALPITSRSILSAKMATVLIGEIGLTIAIGAPLIICYGIHMSLGVTYYLRALAGMIFIPMVPISIAMLLSFLLIRVSGLWKRREGVTTLLTFVFVGAIMYINMNIGMNAAEEEALDMMIAQFFGQASITNMLLGYYPPIRWLMNGITGSGAAAYSQMLQFIVLSVGAIGLMLWLLGGGYLKLALKQEETLRRVNAGQKRKGKDKVNSPFWTIYRQEVRDVITVPIYATNFLAGAIVFPLMMVVMIMSMQKELGNQPLIQILFTFIPRDLYLSIAVAVLSLVTVMGMALGTAVSREGKRHEFIRTWPVKGSTHLLAKLLMGMSINALTIVLTSIALWVIFPVLWIETLIALVLAHLFSLMWAIISLIIDTYHPRFKWKTETEAAKQSINGMYSMLIGIVSIAGMIGVYWLCMKAGAAHTQALAATTMVAIALDALLLKWLCGKASTIYSLREYSK